jgi:tetratricopeptide (TPR) repeat protein
MQATRNLTVAAAMIVRDESTVLADCLGSIQHLVDEIVIVDTGSVDATPEIATRFGAHLHHLAWTGDFAAARNAALDQASSDWILYIDADERLLPIDPAALRAELDRPEQLACTVRFIPRTGFTAYPEYRLFRRDPRIRFSGLIHESIRPALSGLVAAREGYIGVSAATLRHVGYDGDQSHKLDRNEALLRRQIKTDPARAYLWWHLGSVMRDRGRIDDARQLWAEGAARAAQPSCPDPADSLCVIELIRLGLQAGEDVLPAIAVARDAFPGNLMLDWLEAKALVAAGRHAEAIPPFERLAAIDPDALLAPIAYDRRIFGSGAWAELGHCAFRLGRIADSAACYRRARPDLTQARP